MTRPVFMNGHQADTLRKWVSEKQPAAERRQAEAGYLTREVAEVVRMKALLVEYDRGAAAGKDGGE